MSAYQPCSSFLGVKNTRSMNTLGNFLQHNRSDETAVGVIVVGHVQRRPFGKAVVHPYGNFVYTFGNTGNHNGEGRVGIVMLRDKLPVEVHPSRVANPFKLQTQGGIPLDRDFMPIPGLPPIRAKLRMGFLTTGNRQPVMERFRYRLAFVSRLEIPQPLKFGHPANFVCLKQSVHGESPLLVI